MSVVASAPASADKQVKRSKGSVGDCASFDQKDSGDTSVDFTVTNSCTIAVECTVTWSLTCAPDSPKHRSKKFEGASFTLGTTEAKTTTASADRCGDAGWAIDDVSWSCAPSKD
jgi:hypothetical protein